MRTGVRGPPSWPGACSGAGYVDADRPGQLAREPLADGAGHTLTSGSVGRGGGPGLVDLPARFPPEPSLLQECEGHHGQKSVVVQSPPTSVLEMVEPAGRR